MCTGRRVWCWWARSWGSQVFRCSCCWVECMWLPAESSTHSYREGRNDRCLQLCEGGCINQLIFMWLYPQTAWIRSRSTLTTFFAWDSIPPQIINAANEAYSIGWNTCSLHSMWLHTCHTIYRRPFYQWLNLYIHTTSRSAFLVHSYAYTLPTFFSS